MDLVLECGSSNQLENIFRRLLTSSSPGDRIVVTRDDAETILEQLKDEIDRAGSQDGDIAKPVFLQIAGHYIQVKAIATILQQPNGDVAMITVNNGVINIDAMTWMRMREMFESLVEVKAAEVSSLVKGN